MILSHNNILDEIATYNLVENSLPENVNAASLDIRLGKKILVEKPLDDFASEWRKVSLQDRTPLQMAEVDLSQGNGLFILKPGEFILASSIEVFNLPNHISAEYKLKSSMARIGLEHLNAGWCDAGWHGSVLTLELKNVTQSHEIHLRYGDKIGQMIFYYHDPVEAHQSYAHKGTYNNDKQVQGARINTDHVDRGA